MKIRHVLVLLLLIFPLCGLASGDEKAEKKGDGFHASLKAVAEKTLGGSVKILRIEEAGKSRVEGLMQVRLWAESPYGETPVLFYVTDDRQLILAGTVFDGQANNLTRLDVGETKPRTIPQAEMKVNDAFRIGPADAPVSVVLWTGTDPYSKALFDRFFELYEKNRELVSLSFKLYPRTPADLAKMEILTCVQGEQFVSLYRKLLELPPSWGSREEIEALWAEHGLMEKACDRDIIRKDIELSLSLNLPQDPRAFVNGTILIIEPTPGNVGKIAGRELK